MLFSTRPARLALALTALVTACSGSDQSEQSQPTATTPQMSQTPATTATMSTSGASGAGARAPGTTVGSAGAGAVSRGAAGSGTGPTGVTPDAVVAGASGSAAMTGSAGAAGAAGAAASGGTTVVTDGPLNMAPAKFEANVKVSDDEGRSQQTEVVMATRKKDGLILVGWLDNRMSPSVCGYSVSTDGGLTWSKNVFAETQGSGRAFAGDPAVAIDDAGNLYAGCQDYASGGLGTNYILLAHSKDDGKTWSAFERVNQSLDKPWLGALEDGTVLVSWLGNPGGVKRSTDFGATWSDPISLGYINHGTTMSVAYETGIVHMAYNTNEDTVSYRRSLDKGVTFEPVRDLSSQGTACRSPCSPRSHPIIGSGTDPTGQVVAITWASRQNHPDAEGDDDVWVIVSYDKGETFSDPIRVNDNKNESRQFQSWAAVDPYGAVHIVWTDLRDSGQNATYYARMTDPEVGFEPNVQVTDGTGAPPSFLGDYKGLDVIGRDVVVTWTDTRNDSGGDIYFARAKDAAAAGGPLMR